MKFLTPEQLATHNAASRRGVIEGTLASLGIAGVAGWYLQRSVPTFRQLPPSLKAMGVVLIIAPLATIQAERRGLEYDRTQWEGEGVSILAEKQIEEERRWQSMNWKQKVSTWAARNEYPIILGGWAASLAIAGVIISRNKYQSTAQKVVQARMWAQGLTVGIMIAAGALTHSQREDATKHIQNDHSWKEMLDQQERDRQHAAAHKQALSTQPRGAVPATV